MPVSRFERMPQDIFDTLDSPDTDIFDEVYETGGFKEMPPEIGAGPAEFTRGEEYVPTGPPVDLSTWKPSNSFLPSYGVNVPPAITATAPLEQPFLLPAPDTRGVSDRLAAWFTPTPEEVQAAAETGIATALRMPTIPGGPAMPSGTYMPQVAERIMESPTVPGEAAKAASEVLGIINRQTTDPVNLALMVGPGVAARMGVAPEFINIANRILQTSISGRALAETPESAEQLAQAVQTGKPSEYIPAGFQLGLNVGMGALGLHGGLAGVPGEAPVTLRELARRTEVPVKPEPAAPALRESPAAELRQEVSPAQREMNTFDGKGQIEILRVEGDKAIVKDLTTGETRESQGEIFQSPKRVISEEPESIAERAEVQRQVEKLPDNEHLKAATLFNQENGLVSQVRFGEALKDGREIGPFTVATIDTDGTIVVHPRNFLEWMKDPTTAKSPEGLRKSIRSLISEEGIHGVVQRLINSGLITDAEIAGLWENASALKKGFTNLSYTGQWSGRGHTSLQMGHELFRREFQRLMKMKPREVEQLRGGERFKAEVLDLAERAVIALEGVIRPNKELAALIKRTKENIELAREAVEPPEGAVPAEAAAAEFRPEAPEYVREAEEYSRMPSSAFASEMRSKPGGVTGQAFEMGKRLKTEADVQDLIRMRNEVYAKADAVKQQFRQTKNMDLLNEGMQLGAQGQYFNEAIEFATGFPESKQDLYRKLGHADYRPSVQMTNERFAELEAQAKEPALVSAEFRPTERAAEEEKVWDRLEKASGAELDRMISSMNLKAKMGADYKMGKIPDAGAAGEGGILERLRARAVARIGEKMLAEAERQPLDRKTITASEVGWDIESERTGPAYFEVEPELQHSQAMGRKLAEGGRIKGENVSVTRRVTFLRDNATGEIHGVSTFMAGDVPRIRDPESTKAKHVHTDLSELLLRKTTEGEPRYSMVSSVLLEDPVQEFHKRYASEAEFQREIGGELSARKVEVGVAPEVPGEAGTMAGVEGERIPLPATPAAAVPITDSELNSIWNHFAPEEAPSIADVQSRFDSLRVESRGGNRPTARDIQIANGLDKIYQQIRRNNPQLSPDGAMAETLRWIYENTGKEATRSQFVEKGMGEFAIRGAEVGAAREAVPAAPEPAAVPAEAAPTLPVAAEPPQAYFKPTVEKAKQGWDELFLRPMRAYSEWMSDRIRREGGWSSGKFADTINKIISRQRELYGSLTESLDRARKMAGQFGSATQWLHRLKQITPRTAVSNVVPAMEGTIAVPREAQKLIANAQQVNFEAGQVLEPVIENFEAGGAFQRNLTSFGYDTIREGRGKVWEDWTDGLARANGMLPSQVRDFFTDWKEILDSPDVGSANIEKVNQDFARVFPKVVSHVKVGSGIFSRWEPVIHADLFSYLESVAQRASHIRSFRETYPVGSKALKDIMSNARSELREPVQGDLESVVRALQGHPTDVYAGGLLSPSTMVGQSLRFLNQTMGTLISRMVLTGQMLTQASETLVGATPTFLGYNNYLRALGRVGQIYKQMEQNGMVNRVMYDWSYDPTQPFRSATRITGNSFARFFGEAFLNEVQEAMAAATSEVVAERIRTNSLGNWEKQMLPQTLSAMGFTPAQTTAIMRGNAEMLNQFKRKAASWLTSGNKAIAEGSALGANRLFNSVFRFMSYPMAKANQFLRIGKVTRAAWEHGTREDKIAASRMMARFMFHGAMQGSLAVGITALGYEGLYGAKIRAEEAKDEPLNFLLESFFATMGGPLYLVWRGAKYKGLKGIGEQALRTVFPYTMVTDLWDMAQGEGQYKDMDAWDRMGRYSYQKIPGSRAIATALSAVGLSTKNTKLDSATKAFYRWRRSELGYREQDEYLTEDNRLAFRIAMKKAVTALQNGDREGYRNAIAQASAAPGMKRSKTKAAVKSSFKGRHILQFNGKDLTKEQLKSLRDRIGDEPVRRLQYFDKMLDRAAEGAFTQAPE